MTSKKVGIFVDVQNIYYTTRDAFKKSFDYRQFWQYLSYQYDIEVANAYAIATTNDGQRKFQDALRHIGFEVKLKPFIQRSDGSAKGDWDVGITLDVMESAVSVDHIVLISGDGDFDLLLQQVMARHAVKTTVFGVPGLTAGSLMTAAGQFWPIEGQLLFR